MIRATKGMSRSTNHWKGSWIVGRGLKALALQICGSRMAGDRLPDGWGPELVFHGFFWKAFFSVILRIFADAVRIFNMRIFADADILGLSIFGFMIKIIKMLWRN